MDQADLNNRFDFHPADSEYRRTRHEQIRGVAKGAAEAFVQLAPDGRELALAVTKLEEAMMWANAAVARSFSVDDR